MSEQQKGELAKELLETRAELTKNIEYYQRQCNDIAYEL